MSSLICIGVQLDSIEKHPNADALDLVWVGDYQAIVQKDRFKPGDRAIYIGEQAIVPHELLKSQGFWNNEKDEGMLAGPDHNRVKAIRLRGIFSQGIIITPFIDYEVGKDYSTELNVVKWEPPIPAHLAGQVVNTTYGNFTYTDIENLKFYPDVIHDEEVIITEKLHGTCAIFHCVYNASSKEYEFFVSSKGHASRGLALVENDHNFYWRIAKKYDLRDKLIDVLIDLREVDQSVASLTLFGEGLGVQDLKYGFTGNDAASRFFDLRYCSPKEGNVYIDHFGFESFMMELSLPHVPILYTGPYSKEVVAEHTVGKSLLADHIREGVVIRPTREREDAILRRVILKSISEDYLMRKNKDATEFE